MTLTENEAITAGGDASGRRRRWPWIAGLAALAAVVFVLVWFQPQKLFIDDEVNDAVPTVPPSVVTSVPPTSGGASTTAVPPTTVPEIVDLARGEFVSLDHGTSGVVRVLQLADGSRFVRLEGLATDNGPDLFLYLSTNPPDGPEQAFDDDFVNLGRLRGNLGDQNYELPPDVELGRFVSVVIWCDRFNSAFGAAPI